MLKLLLLLALRIGAQEQPIQVDHFLGLDDSDPSATMPNYQAQDALNVESSLDGTALKKREGYTRIATLTITTSNVNGSTKFTDLNGNQQSIVCHDHYCSKSTNGGAFSVFLTTGGGTAIPTRWSFVSNNGFLYGANDKRDKVFYYDGATILYSTTIPQGTLLELTKDRLIVADVAGVPNGVYYSQSGVYSNFTAGINSIDPYIDYIGASGDKVTALKAIGDLYIFKNNSITGCSLGDQYSSVCNPISNTIGTSDPGSIVEIPGAILFQGNNRGYWALTDGGINLLSKKISAFTASQNIGTSQGNIQTSLSDWSAGTSNPGSTWNPNTIAGSIVNASSTFQDVSTGAFFSGSGAGEVWNAGWLGVPGITSTYTWRYMADVLPVSATVQWTKNGSFNESVSGGTLTIRAAGSGDGYAVLLSPLVYPSTNAIVMVAQTSLMSGADTVDLCLNDALDANCDNSLLRWINSGGVSTVFYAPSCGGGSATDNLSAVTFSTYTIVFSSTSLETYSTTTGLLAKTCSLSALSSPNTYKYLALVTNNTNPFYVKQINYTNQIIDPGASISSGPFTFRSRIYDTSFSTIVSGPFNSTATIPSGAGIAYFIRASSSPNNDLWTSTVSAIPGQRFNLKDRYLQYWATITANGFTEAPGITGVSAQFASTGSYTSQCIQPGVAISTWGAFSCGQSLTGLGSVLYYTTSAVSCAALPASPPYKWVLQTNNSMVASSTNAAMYFGAVSLLGSATDQVRLDDCSVNWTAGIGQPISATYDPVKNAVYWTASVSNSATANRVLKYDLNLGEFYPFALNASGFININNVNYFGDSTGGYWNKFGGAVSDNGSAINAYWKSKDFGGGSPFVEKNFNNISLAAKNQVTGSMTVNYNTSNGVSSSYTVSLSTGSSLTYVRANRKLALMSPAQYINIQLGNNSIYPFEIDGMQIDFTSKPWTPQNP